MCPFPVAAGNREFKLLCSRMALLNRLFDKCFGLSKLERKIPLSSRRGKLCFDVCIKHFAAL